MKNIFLVAFSVLALSLACCGSFSIKNKTSDNSVDYNSKNVVISNLDSLYSVLQNHFQHYDSDLSSRELDSICELFLVGDHLEGKEFVLTEGVKGNLNFISSNESAKLLLPICSNTCRLNSIIELAYFYFTSKEYGECKLFLSRCFEGCSESRLGFELAHIKIYGYPYNLDDSYKEESIIELREGVDLMLNLSEQRRFGLAQQELGFMYYNGNDMIKQDKDRALELLVNAYNSPDLELIPGQRDAISYFLDEHYPNWK